MVALITTGSHKNTWQTFIQHSIYILNGIFVVSKYIIKLSLYLGICVEKVKSYALWQYTLASKDEDQYVYIRAWLFKALLA